ncbi:MAG: autotransporter domain-containing protein [Burkholderiaceae bacterium]
MAFKLKANRAAIVAALLAASSWANVQAAGNLPRAMDAQGAIAPTPDVPSIASILDMAEQLDRKQLQSQLSRVSEQQKAAFRDAFASLSDTQLRSLLEGRDITALREKLRGQGVEHVFKRGADSIAEAEQAQRQGQTDASRDHAQARGETDGNRTPEQEQADRLKRMIEANRAQLALGTLYAAVPGSVLALGDAMVETAMGPAMRSGAADGKGVWGRMSLAGARPMVTTGLKTPAGSFTNDSRLQANTLTAQFGMPAFSNATTRLDATIGLGGRTMQLSPNRKNDPDLKTYSVAVGGILQHRAPADIDLRLGAQISGGGSVLKGPGMDAAGRDFEQKFKHIGLGLRAEASRDFAVGRGVVVTPLLGVGASTAWVRQNNASTDNNNSASVWASTRLAYNHAMQTGRTASFWVEPTYIAQLKRSTTITTQFNDIKLDITSRLPRDRVGVRLGMDLPMGKQASFQASLSRFWGVGSSRQQDGVLNLGYVHRF